jgi:ashwin
LYNYLNVVFQRYIQNEDLSSLSKEGLVELYYSYVLPLPQRKYRLNRRGKEMTKKQIVMAKKRKISTTDDSEPPKKSVNRSFAHF